jgi:hypothetical protein
LADEPACAASARDLVCSSLTNLRRIVPSADSRPSCRSVSVSTSIGRVAVARPSATNPRIHLCGDRSCGDGVEFDRARPDGADDGSEKQGRASTSDRPSSSINRGKKRPDPANATPSRHPTGGPHARPLRGGSEHHPRRFTSRFTQSNSCRGNTFGDGRGPVNLGSASEQSQNTDHSLLVVTLRDFPGVGRGSPEAFGDATPFLFDISRG